MVGRWPPERKRTFVEFVTGTARLPVPGSELLRVEAPFVAIGVSEHQQQLGMLPQAHTCDNLLELPGYWQALLQVSCLCRCMELVTGCDVCTRSRSAACWGSRGGTSSTPFSRLIFMAHCLTRLVFSYAQVKGIKGSASSLPLAQKDALMRECEKILDERLTLAVTCYAGYGLDERDEDDDDDDGDNEGGLGGFGYPPKTSSTPPLKPATGSLPMGLPGRRSPSPLPPIPAGSTALPSLGFPQQPLPGLRQQQQQLGDDHARLMQEVGSFGAGVTGTGKGVTVGHGGNQRKMVLDLDLQGQKDDTLLRLSQSIEPFTPLTDLSAFNTRANAGAGIGGGNRPSHGGEPQTPPPAANTLSPQPATRAKLGSRDGVTASMAEPPTTMLVAQLPKLPPAAGAGGHRYQNTGPMMNGGSGLGVFSDSLTALEVPPLDSDDGPSLLPGLPGALSPDGHSLADSYAARATGAAAGGKPAGGKDPVGTSDLEALLDQLEGVSDH